MQEKTESNISKSPVSTIKQMPEEKKVSWPEIGKRVKKTEENPYGYKKVTALPPHETCVLYLGGNGSVSDKAANGYAKIIQNEILDSIDASIPVYSVTYHFEKNDDRLARDLEYIRHRKTILQKKESKNEKINNATEEELNPKYIDDLFRHTILPRISQKDGKEKLPTQEACKNIRKLNIVAHCHGGYVALKLEEKMQESMKALGYNDKDRELIQSQMMVIAHAPDCPLGVSKSQFISFRSAYDSELDRRNKDWTDAYIFLKKQEERKYICNIGKEEKDQYEPFHLKPCYFPGKQGNLFLIKRKFRWDKELEYPFMTRPEEHNDTSYSAINQTQDGKIMAHFAKTILTNGIQNSLKQEEKFTPLPPIEKLILSNNPTLRTEEKNLFEKMKENGKLFRQKVFKFAVAVDKGRGKRDSLFS